MPAKSEWLLRLPEIRAELERLEVPVVDRSVIERIFGLKRRRAIELMHKFGGYQAGRTFLLDRTRLMEALQTMESADAYAAEKRRHERLQDVVDAAREHRVLARVRIPVRATAARPSLVAGAGSSIDEGAALHRVSRERYPCRAVRRRSLGKRDSSAEARRGCPRLPDAPRRAR